MKKEQICNNILKRRKKRIMKNLFKYEFRFYIACITGLILIIQISETQAQNIVFSEDSVISTGYKPFALASEDFNADEMPDVTFVFILDDINGGDSNDPDGNIYIEDGMPGIVIHRVITNLRLLSG